MRRMNKQASESEREKEGENKRRVQGGESGRERELARARTRAEHLKTGEPASDQVRFVAVPLVDDTTSIAALSFSRE